MTNGLNEQQRSQISSRHDHREGLLRDVPAPRRRHRWCSIRCHAYVTPSRPEIATHIPARLDARLHNLRPERDVA